MALITKHTFLFLSLIYLWLYDTLSHALVETAHPFYLASVPAAIAIVWGILYMGEATRQILLKQHILRNFYSGANWGISMVLGGFVFGNLAILFSSIPISDPLWYQGTWTALVVLSAWWVSPRTLLTPFRRIWSTFVQHTQLQWLWIVLTLFVFFRALTAFLLVNGTEQLHNTLPFAKYLFRGVDFNTYDLDNHFLLLGTYETFGVFIRAFATNDFAYQLTAQLTTFLLTIGSMCLILGSIPWLLRKAPAFAALLWWWPATLNFAPSDTLAFKPDWIGIISAGLASMAMARQWKTQNSAKHHQLMGMVVIFGAIATCNKLTALPYLVFLLPLTVLVAVFRFKRVTWKHLAMPVLYLALCSVFFIKNTVWLGNPFFPGFQDIIPKPDHLSHTTTFNTFKINKITRKIPEASDYVYGYVRFWKHHPEFVMPLIWIFLLGWRRKFAEVPVLIFGYFFVYLTLIVVYFYPSIYQRYVAFVYILFLLASVLSFLQLKPFLSKRLQKWHLAAFGILMLTHAGIETNLVRSSDWWLQGMTPREFRYMTDTTDEIYDLLNRECPNPGRVLNRYHRNYLYANFDTVSFIDIQGSYYHPKGFDDYDIQFVILDKGGVHERETIEEQKHNPWFSQNFTVIYETPQLQLWKRNSFTQCFQQTPS